MIGKKAQAELKTDQQYCLVEIFPVVPGKTLAHLTTIALQPGPAGVHIETDLQGISPFAAPVAAGAQTISQIIVQKPRSYSIKINETDNPLLRGIEEKIIEFGIAVDNPSLQDSLGAGLLQERGHIPVVLNHGKAVPQSGIPGFQETAVQAVKFLQIGGQDMETGKWLLYSLDGEITDQVMEAPEGQTDLRGLRRVVDSSQRSACEIFLGSPYFADIVLKPGSSLPSRQKPGKTGVRSQLSLSFFEMLDDNGKIFGDGYRIRKNLVVDALQDKRLPGGRDKVGYVDVAGTELLYQGFAATDKLVYDMLQLLPVIGDHRANVTMP